MIFDGKIDLDVPVNKAWDFLIDINKFSACLPGIEEVKQIDDKTFEGALVAAVGPISGKFTFRATIVESHPPDQMVVTNRRNGFRHEKYRQRRYDGGSTETHG